MVTFLAARDEIYRRMTKVGEAFADLYPMVLIDGWAAAMTNSELGRVTPLYSGGVWYRGFGFDLKALDDAVTGGLTLGSHRLSLFLVPDDPLLDLSGAWQDVESTVGSRQAFAVVVTGEIAKYGNILLKKGVGV